MTHLTNIPHHILRTALCLALLLCTTITTSAQTTAVTNYSQTSVWNGTDATPTGGSALRPKSLIDPSCTGDPGSATNPYLIESAADLKYLQSKTNLYGKCFEQMVDIDLGDFAEHGKLLGTIGSSEDGNNPFTGTYDGRGHKITNLRVEWNTTSNVACGLFGYLKGEVRNLVIDNALVTRGEGATTSAMGSTDFKIGVLAGCVAPKSTDEPAVIENISIINSVINDGGKNSDIKAAFIGGLVGDITNGFGGTHRMDKYGQVRINNIYSEVEIDLTNYTPNGSNAYQFNVGGIFGRLRRGMEEDLPTNTIFTGQIKAPNGMVGPIFGASRADGESNEKGMMLHYAGQVTPEGETIDEPKTYHFIDAATFNATNLFYDYKLWNGSTFVDIDDDTPLVLTTLAPHTQGGITRGASYRSFAAANPNSTANTAAAIGMTKFQGVNKGGLLADASAAADKLAALSFDYQWNLDTSTKDATLEEITPAVRSLAAEHTAWNKFTATLSGAAAGETFHYRWFAVNSKGERTEIALSESSVLEGLYLVPADAKELIVFLCKADDTYYLDNGHYVYAFCLPQYKVEALEVAATTAADKVHVVLTPKLKIKNVQDAEDVVEITSFNGWEFGAKIFTGDNGKTLKYTFPDKFAGAAAPYTIPPTVNDNAWVQLVGTLYGLSFTTDKVAFPHYLRGNTSTGWARVKSVDGQRYTLTFGTASKSTGSEVYGDNVYFSNSPEEDWGIIYKWDIGYYVGEGNSFNGIKDYALTESEEWEENGQLKCWVKDLAAYYRYYKLTLTDAYGLTVSPSFQWGDNWIEYAHTNLRYVQKRDGLQNYYFKMQFSDGTYLDSNGNKHDKPYITINPEMYNHFKWTYSVEGVATEQNVKLEVSLGDFSIQNVYMNPRTYAFTYTDQYEQSQVYNEKLTLAAPGAELVMADNKIHPELTIDGKKYFIKEEDGRGLTYSWKVTLLGENDEEIGDVRDYTGDELPAQTITDATKSVKVVLTITDAAGDTKDVERIYSIDKLYVDVEQTGTAPNYTFTASLYSFASRFPIAGGKWKWYGVNGDITEDTSNRYLLAGQTSNVLTLNSTNNNYTSYCVVWTSEESDISLMGYWSKANIIYVFDRQQTVDFNTNANGYDARNVGRFDAMLQRQNADGTDYFPDGSDFNDGRTPQTAVQTMKRAYELLEPGKAAKENIIVVMGFLFDKKYLRSQEANAITRDYDRNATITGNYGEVSDGILRMNGSGSFAKVYESDGVLGLGGSTIFKDITFYGGKYKNTSGTTVTAELHLYCHLHDLTLGTGIKIENYPDFGKNTYGLIEDAAAPKITIVGGFHNYAGTLEYPESNAVKGQTTINIFSGCWGRIIASSRNNDINFTSHNIFAHPEHPHRVEVNVAIKHGDPTSTLNEYTPDKDGSHQYKYDIGLLVGGQTDGTVYVESKQRLISGTVGRFISGNISYGRNMAGRSNDPQKNKMFPSDAFYGSTTLTIEGGEIGELVGGTLGRHDDTSVNGSEKCEAYFYGRSILNVNGGTIKRNIYGAGAGGVVGLHKTDKDGNAVVIADADWHTKDQAIPYYGEGVDYNGYRNIEYGNYDAANGNMPTMTLLNGQTLDLAQSYCEVNINGGVVEGDVFGGGYGFTEQVKVEKALDQSGNLYGEAYVNISGGTIKGNVYGGGAGTNEYYFRRIAHNYYEARITAGRNATQAENDRKAFIEAHKEEWLKNNIDNSEGYVTQADIDDAKAKFSDLANLFGDTHVSISGGVIEGKLFAGAKGISAFPKMATLYGNTNLTIENKEMGENTTRVPIINNNIYGGSELGKINGNTNVVINGGAIGNCIFGGSEGLEADKTVNGELLKKTTAYIDGSTNLTITGGTYFTSDYAAKISTDNQIAASDRTFNIYGGGYNNCVIEESTNVTLQKSLLTSYLCLIEPDPTDATKKRSFEDCVNDRTYRKFSVYGAGRGELTDVKGDAILTVSIEGGASVPSAKPKDVANGQQFFMIAGGGMAGHVWRDTKVTLDGNVFARRIYGGGMYGNVLGDANLTVRRGSYYGIFGGGLLGNVKGNANLRIGVKAGQDEITHEMVSFDDAADANRNLYVYENVYGGNDVSGCTGYDTTDQLWNDGNLENFVVEGDNFVMPEDKVQYHYLFEHWAERNPKGAGKPYYRHLIRASEDKGVNMKIYGGRILGDVFGAGNGNHTGYYVPNAADSEHHNAGAITRMMYYEGLPYHYRVNKKDENSYEGTPDYNAATNTYTGTLKSVLDPKVRQEYGLYEYRPRVAKVVMHIGGNSETDRVFIGGEVFGGGHACTIGRYDPSRDVLTDPLRFEGGGTLKMNFGSHVTVQKSVFMGSRGRIIGEQTKIEPANTYVGTTLNSDYDYHYYDHEQKRYLLGFPNTKEGRMRFHAYMQLVNMDATTELSFFDQTNNSESTDVRWGSFFAGGARGSMTKYIDGTSAHPAYEYTLPAGLTVETRVVGGSEDAEITYYDYTTKTGETAFTEIDETKPMFTFYGGIVYDEHTDGHYGGGQVRWHEETYNESADYSSDPVQADADTLVGDEAPRGSLTVMKLNVNCQFDPQKAIAYNDDYENYNRTPGSGEVSDDGEQYWGGLVYGGCYNSGITNGSVEVTCTNTLLGKVDAGFDTFQDYIDASSLRRNLSRVYGGGYGEKANILGNTKVTLDGNFRGFNIFGGGMKGSVMGGTEVNVQGGSLVYNAVYGGGMLSDIGLEADDYFETVNGEPWNKYKDLYAKGTHINLISGGVDRVYGGAFMGSVSGGTHITVSDAKAVEAAGETGDGVPTRLMVGTIYGGNDVTGTIHPDANDNDVAGNTNPAKDLCTYIAVSETPSAKKTADNKFYLNSESTTEPGKFYAGYPMVGTIYGAGNGDMSDYVKGVMTHKFTGKYTDGRIHIANGDGAHYNVFEVGEFDLPNVDDAKIDITGGTIINVYAGGSMCTTNRSNNVTVHYTDTVARASFLTDKNDVMTWGILRLTNLLQQEEVTEAKGDYTRFSHQIYRVFGGNNLMDMAIQPTLDLRRGYIFSVYSGGNFGRMTYKNPSETLGTGEYRGLSLTIDSEDIHISTVYGGGRVGDIDAGEDFTSPDEYGATLNIKSGLIGDVYGGNNVAGNVRNGTNVNITGAISGNVYGSGNGNYIYVYNHDDADVVNNQEVIYKQFINEGYDEAFGGCYFVLPKKDEYGDSDEEKILAINSYRPNVDRTYLNIEGTEDSQVYILGNAYCGGNSSTVLFNEKNEGRGDIRFRIGNYVTLGGVFLGSNGEGLANPFNINYLANLNGIADLNVATQKGTPEELALYPNLLSLYMRAVEVTALPTELSLPEGEVKEAYIGNFCLGGNRGSMMTDKTIDLTLPEGLVIFDRVVGGCYNSLVEYKGATSMGGMTKPLGQKRDSNGELLYDTENNPIYYTDKVNLKVRSTFRPWRMEFSQSGFGPTSPLAPAVRFVNDRQKKTKVAGEEVFVDVSDAEAAANPTETYYYTEDRCNIFGGCYTSGKTVGDIKIDIYSDMIGRYVQADASTQAITENGETILADAQGRYLQVNRKQLMHNTSERRTVFAVMGAGYGPLSELEGNVHLRLLPQATTEAATTHPTLATIFGGAHNGKHIGNSTTEVRDGMVFSNLYAGSRAAYKYGSSEVIVGYPTYYICKQSGTYTLDRADKITTVAKDNLTNADGTPVIKQTVKYRQGDIVAKNVYEQIIDDAKSTKFDKIEDVEDVEGVETSITPASFGSTWDNISINIGDNSAMNDPSAHFYGGGGIYGGGHAINQSSVTHSGVNTQLAFSDKDEKGEEAPNYLNAGDIGYGGNSTIIIGDNPANCAMTDGEPTYATTGPNGEAIRDHISIGTAHYVEKKIDLKKGDKIGTYVKQTDAETGKVCFVHQAAGLPTEGVTYYEMEADGGVYGDGRRTFVENFRAVDITGYGYADYTPQHAKLINTFQRMDLLSLNDCCLQLQGAQDYATNSIDATLYSIARVGELRLNSSLTGNIPASTENEAVAGGMSLDVKRSRNYMGFFNNVHYIGAMYSNTPFTSDYRDAGGQLVEDQTYKGFKKDYISAYEGSSPRNETAFKPRNLGTAPNMMGINNGYTLKLQNAYTTEAKTSAGMLEDVPDDHIYYGPILGVVEVKLLTLAQDEGGGYIYAFNKHETDDTSGLLTDGKGNTFLEETGNFVYPATVNAATNNYIIDDCYPLGYYGADWNPTTHADDEEAHYWYVQGHHYYFNTTLTAYTYNGNLINFKLKNDDDLIILSGITPATGNTIELKSVQWESHLTDDDKCALTNDLRTAADVADGKDDSRSNYQLYLTINGDTQNDYDLKQDGEGNYTNVGNAFVARIPNGNNVTDDDDKVTQAAYAAKTDGTVQQKSNYSDKSATEKNTPLLGIRLQDTDSGNYKPDFYKAHLDDDDNLVITITATDAGDGQQNTYTINLKIVYLQGPYIDGHLTVENCALPGEYIYANTGDVTVEMDEALTVTGKKWYLYPRKKADPSKDIYTWDMTENGRVDVSQYLMDNIAGDVNRLQLPARYYQNDWKLGYCIFVNGQAFPLEDQNSDATRITVHNYHRMSTVAKEVKGDLTYGYDLDLDLVGGALVYIEDDEDFAIFTKYVNYCNTFRREKPADADGYIYRMALPDADPSNPEESTSLSAVAWQKDKNGSADHWARVLRAEVLPGYNRYGFITGFKNNNTVLGYDDTDNVEFTNLKNPSGAEGIRFVLNADVNASADASTIEEFRGQLYGNGHVIAFQNEFKGKDFITRNYGQIRDVGFVSNGGENPADDVTYVVKSNRGLVENSYYYHFPAGHPESTDDFSAVTYSGIIGQNDTETVPSANDTETEEDAVQTFKGRVSNCVQNTNQSNADATLGVRYRPNKMFHNGRVAYNLNREYLQARYLSKDDDAQAHETMQLPSYDTDTKQNDNGDYLFNYYADGEYRYAGVRSPEHPECLRMAENHGVPNYENNLGNGMTMHYTGDDAQRDARRWFKISQSKLVERDARGRIIYTTDADGNTVLAMTDKGYFPIYRYEAVNGVAEQSPEHLADHSDYIFFGQRLTTGKDRDYYPRRVNSTNRVYRAGGSYGSRTDLGFHFNRDAWAFSPELTAIDFTGDADLKDANGEPIYAKDWGYYYYYYYGAGLPSGTTYKTYVNENENKISAMVDDMELRMIAYYPPLLDLPGGLGDHNLHNMTGFHIDSNDDVHDHTKVTKNLLVYTPEANDEADGFSTADSERLFGQLHYTRMQRWGAGETKQDDIIGHHINWVSHAGNSALGAHFHAANGFFHLADEQDFNAPIEFFVASDGEDATSGRAWFLRKPKRYATRAGSAVDVNGFTVSKNAWESIALPFTCNRVVAVNSGDYVEKYSRGQITHFYGSDPLRGTTHHDYWLRGLVTTAPDTYTGDDVIASADFARPGKSYTDEGGQHVPLFEVKGEKSEKVDGTEVRTPTDEQMTGNYVYKNDWFYNVYKEVAYSPTHNEYADTLRFNNYSYLTKNAPYIVAFPGCPENCVDKNGNEDFGYYEFDLSGNFFNFKNSTNGCHEQEILYEFTVDEIDEGNNFDSQTQSVRIPVTDLYDAVCHTEVKSGSMTTTHHTTFKRIVISDKDDEDEDLYVLNDGTEDAADEDGCLTVNVKGTDVTLLPGSAFINCKDFGITEILPFRTYLEVKGEPAGARSRRYVLIGSPKGGIDDQGGGEENDPGDDTFEPRQLDITLEGNVLVITANYETSLPLYTISGQMVRRLSVFEGRNTYHNLPPALYIVGGKKFAIK